MHAYDVIIVGGGPGGAAAATALARRGRRVLVLEREVFPRFHIGESQLPWSRELWRELGLDEALGRAGFVDKWGATFITANGAVEQYADFTAATETPQPQTYQVPRAEFDRIVLAHAAASGADVRQPAQAVDLTFEHDGVTVRFLADGTQLEMRAAAIVDASGRAGFVARRR
ncbi:MAG: FAD-dependent oxidoreductase, partial [Deltaproteobacteria bacterium]